jgi:hypothetical protein
MRSVQHFSIHFFIFGCVHAATSHGRFFAPAGNPADPVGDMVKAGEKIIDPWSPKRPLMPAINAMRAMMCWGRENLIEHEKCMEWLMQHCQEASTGHGYCEKFWAYLRDQCKAGEQKACKKLRKLGAIVPDKDAAPEPKDKAENPIEAAGKAMEKADEDAAKAVAGEDGDKVPEKDSDGDGVGDSSDRWPNDPTCAHDGDTCGEHAVEKQEDAEVAVIDDDEEEKPGKEDNYEIKKVAKGGRPSKEDLKNNAPLTASPPFNASKMDADDLLPDQGYDEHSKYMVEHDDMKTMTKDWHTEWPMQEGTEDETVMDICRKKPNNPYCKLKLSRKARRKYVNSHP